MNDKEFMNGLLGSWYDFVSFIFNNKHKMPDSIDDLNGPSHGCFELKNTIDWSPGDKICDLSNHKSVVSSYSLILSEGSKEDICKLINKDKLKEVLEELIVNHQIRCDWENKFHDFLNL